MSKSEIKGFFWKCLFCLLFLLGGWILFLASGWIANFIPDEDK